jgi:hypothetical protein
MFSLAAVPQHRDVFRAFAQGRDHNRKHIQAIEEVWAKRPGSNGLLQIAIGGSDYPHISSNEPISTNTLKKIQVLLCRT